VHSLRATTYFKIRKTSYLRKQINEMKLTDIPEEIFYSKNYADKVLKDT
jgi:hypothetical protein